MKTTSRKSSLTLNAISLSALLLSACGGAYLINAANAATCYDSAPCNEYECNTNGYKCQVISLISFGAQNDKAPYGEATTVQCGQLYAPYQQPCQNPKWDCGGFVPKKTSDCPVGKPKE